MTVLRCTSDIVFACNAAACRPPGKNGGTGGSLPSTPGAKGYIAGVYRAAGIGAGFEDPVSPKLRVISEGHPPSAVKNALKQNGAVRVGKQIEGKVNWSKDISDPDALSDSYGYVTSSAMADEGGAKFLTIFSEISGSKMREAISSGNGAEFAQRYKEITGIPLESVVVAAMQQGWGGNFGGPLCRDIMKAAGRLLPMNGTASPSNPVWDNRGVSPLSTRLIGRVVKQVYRNTQGDLKRLKVKEVTLVRGVNTGHPEDGPVNVELRPLSSWTVSSRTASHFGGRGYSVTVPASRVFSTSSSGFGCSFEHEVILLGGTYPATSGNPIDLVVDA
jgi:hypothetical protein